MFTFNGKQNAMPTTYFRIQTPPLNNSSHTIGITKRSKHCPQVVAPDSTINHSICVQNVAVFLQQTIAAVSN